MRMEAKPLIAAHLAYVHEEVVCCHVAQLLLRFTPLLSASPSSEPLQTPAPRHDPPIHPTYTGNDSTHVVDSPWRPPLLPVVAVRHTKAVLSCTVLSDSPVTPLPTNHCFSTAATN
jgi:hypothetical protein